MNAEPTQEQIKEFWEWCGFRFETGDFDWCYTPDGNHLPLGEVPLIDLNNLFRYAVPKMLENYGRLKTVEVCNNAVCKDIIEPYKEGKLAIHLFWELYGVMNNERI